MVSATVKVLRACSHYLLTKKSMNKEKATKGDRLVTQFRMPKEVFGRRRCEQGNCRKQVVMISLDITDVARPFAIPGTARCAGHVTKKHVPR